MIWSLVLVNPELGSPGHLKRDQADDENDEGLGLTPAILRTCRQIYYDAFAVLYGTNTFVFSIFRDKMGHSHILKGKFRDCRFPRKFDANIVPGFKHIKHWKVIISPKAYERSFGPLTSFSNFCRAIVDSDIKTLEISFVRADDCELMYQVSHKSLVWSLQPLNFLGNLTRLEVKEFENDGSIMTLQGLFEGGVGEPGKADATEQPVLLPDEQNTKLKMLTLGNATVFHLFNAQEKLTAYGKAFERNEELKAAMKLQYREALLWVGTSQWTWGDSLKNQFLKHPVEMGVVDAIIASGVCKAKDFREARESAIMYLEPQYQRITEAALEMANFAKSLEKAAVRFGANDSDEKEVCRMAKILVQDYAKSFERDIPETIRAYIEENPEEFEKAYCFLPREKLLRLMGKAAKYLEAANDRKKFMHIVGNVVDDMDKQYLEIRHARLALFEHDPTDPECDIDLELCRSYEEFDKTAQEPRVDPDESSKVGSAPQTCGGIGFDRAPAEFGSTPSSDLTTPKEQDTEALNGAPQATKNTEGAFVGGNTGADIGGNLKSSIKSNDTEGEPIKDKAIPMIISPSRNRPIIPIFI